MSMTFEVGSLWSLGPDQTRPETSASASPSPVTGPVQSRAQLTMAGQPAASEVTRRNVVRQDPRGAMDNMYSQHRNW